jgi:imidazoleglycerol-phosphate dehydratase
MIDQFNSHAQIGVSITVLMDGDEGISADEDAKHKKHVNVNRFVDRNQSEILTLVGKELGKSLQTTVLSQVVAGGSSSRFCCPLDEALVECILIRRSNQQQSGALTKFTLSPYGKHPLKTGRTKIGQLETAAIESFFSSLAIHSGLEIQLHKVRGDNGHHIVESAFKALSRALRNLIDGTNTTCDDNKKALLWGPNSESFRQSVALERRAKIQRQTKETSILVDLKLDGRNDNVSVRTGIAVLDDFFTTLAIAASMSLTIDCQGDLWIDDHHTSEDVGIAVGQCLNKALGSKAGLNRMWNSTASTTSGGAVVEVTMDLSNRPCLTQNLTLDQDEYVVDEESVLTTEMMAHVLESLVMNGMMTVHIVEKEPGASVKNRVMATALAFGEALKYCTAVDPRRAGTTASSKGTLSV